MIVTPIAINALDHIQTFLLEIIEQSFKDTRVTSQVYPCLFRLMAPSLV